MLRKVNKKQGFTLVEIMIVVGIITMLAALSIHNLLRAKMTANEAIAISNLRTLQTAMDSYNAVNGRYPETWDFIVELCTAIPPYLDSSWEPNQWGITTKQGYVFNLKSRIRIEPNGQEYMIFIYPERRGVTGERSFILSQMSGRSPEITDGLGNGLGATPN